jgi:hypothetical protein
MLEMYEMSDENNNDNGNEHINEIRMRNDAEHEEGLRAKRQVIRLSKLAKRTFNMRLEVADFLLKLRRESDEISQHAGTQSGAYSKAMSGLLLTYGLDDEHLGKNERAAMIKVAEEKEAVLAWRNSLDEPDRYNSMSVIWEKYLRQKALDATFIDLDELEERKASKPKPDKPNRGPELDAAHQDIEDLKTLNADLQRENSQLRGEYQPDGGRERYSSRLRQKMRDVREFIQNEWPGPLSHTVQRAVNDFEAICKDLYRLANLAEPEEIEEEPAPRSPLEEASEKLHALATDMQAVKATGGKMDGATLEARKQEIYPLFEEAASDYAENPEDDGPAPSPEALRSRAKKLGYKLTRRKDQYRLTDAEGDQHGGGKAKGIDMILTLKERGERMQLETPCGQPLPIYIGATDEEMAKAGKLVEHHQDDEPEDDEKA